MVDPTDEEIAAWADGFIRQNAYNRAVAVQIATEAAKWVRGKRVQVGWYYEMPVHERNECKPAGEPVQNTASVEGLMELVLHYGEQEHACLLQEAMDAYAAIRAYAQRLKEGK